MNGSADEADILRFLDRGLFISGFGCGIGDGCGDGYGDGRGSGCGSGCGSSRSDSTCYGSGYGWGYYDGTGDGFGSGFGNGSGSGSEPGNGFGGGHGSGSGSIYGSTNGYSKGNDIKMFNGQNVYNIDGTMTIVSSVHGAYAKGYILLDDLTLKPTYIAKVGGFFAHGDTLCMAREDALAKCMKCEPVEQRIADFIKAHPSRTRKYAGEDLYGWHGILTGSCRAGRAAWCSDKGLDPKTTKLTVKQFCELTKDAYGGDVIRRLAKTVEIELK